MNYYIEVYLENSNYKLNRKFTYLITSEQFNQLKCGMLVEVPFNKRVELAYVSNISSGNELDSEYELKYIDDIHHSQMLNNKQIIMLNSLIEDSLCSFMEALDIVYPRNMRKLYRSKSTIKNKNNAIVHGYNLSNVEITDDKLKVLNMIFNDQQTYTKKQIIEKSIHFKMKLSDYQINKALKLHYLIKSDVDKAQLTYDDSTTIIEQLTEEQIQCLDEIKTSDNDILLLGKTGSGKTEIIKYLINQISGQILIVEPNKLLAKQIFERLKSSFGNKVCLYDTSSKSASMRSNYEMIMSGEIKIVIGLKNSIFAPFANLELVVVDEEHDLAYLNDYPAYTVHNILRTYAKKEKYRTILMSATPSFESIARSQKNYYQLVHLPNSFSKHETEIKLAKLDSYETGLTPDAIMAIKAIMDEGKKVIIYHNARGYASSVECEHCMRVPTCPKCGETLKYYADETLRCHNCNFKIDFTNHCSRCKLDGSYKLIGIGIEQIYENLVKYFSEYKIHKIDSNTSMKERDEFLKEFKEEKAQILLGTNMILNGIDFDNIKLAVVTNVDNSLRNKNTFSEEAVYQNLIQLMGRIGKKEQKSTLFIQSKLEQHIVFEMLYNNDYLEFYNEQYQMRKLMHKYPFRQYIKCTVLDLDYQTVWNKVNYLDNEIRKQISTIHLNTRMNKKIRIGNEFYYSVDIIYEYNQSTNFRDLYQIFNKFKKGNNLLRIDRNFINKSE